MFSCVRVSLAFVLLWCGFSVSEEIQEQYPDVTSPGNHLEQLDGQPITGALLINQIALLEILKQKSEAQPTATAACPIINVTEYGSSVDVELFRSELSDLEINLESSVKVVLESIINNVTDVVRSVAEEQESSLRRMKEELGSAIAGLQTHLNRLDAVLLTPSPAPAVSSSSSTNGRQLVCSGSGSVTNVSATWGYLTSNTGSTYSNGLLCTWTITAPPGASISLLWEKLETEACNNCGCDWIEVKDVGSSIGRRYCGTVKPPTTTHNVRSLDVTFRSDGSQVKGGFKLQYIVA